MANKRAFALLCGVGLFAFVSYNLIRMPLLPLFAQSLGAAPETIGFIVAASTLTGVVLKWPAGALSDIYDRRWLLLVGLLAFALPPWGYLFIEDVRWLIALRFLHGTATAVFGPIAMSVIADLFRGTRGVALGSYTAATQAGAMLGPLLGGWLVTVAGFPTAFAAAGLMGTTALLLFLVTRLPPQIPHIPSAPGLAAVVRDMVRGARAVVNNFRVMVTSAADGARQIANGALMAFLPIYVVSIGMDAAQAGLLFGIQSVTSFVSRPTMGWASDHLGRRPLILGGLIACAVAIAAIPFTQAFAGLLALSAVFGFGEAIVNASAAALVADLSELKTLGSAMGMQGAVMDVGHAAGPILAGFLVSGLGFQGAFPVIAGVVLAAAGSFYLAVKTERSEPPLEEKRRVL
jgi:DHA1 family multidrug resistance protein-like MFS transporter